MNYIFFVRSCTFNIFFLRSRKLSIFVHLLTIFFTQLNRIAMDWSFRRSFYITLLFLHKNRYFRSTFLTTFGVLSINFIIFCICKNIINFLIILELQIKILPNLVSLFHFLIIAFKLSIHFSVHRCKLLDFIDILLSTWTLLEDFL